MDTTGIFAKRLSTLREEKGISQQVLADALGVTRQSLSLYEKAERTINTELLVKIANYFNVSADYLLGLSEVSSIDSDLQVACKVTGLSEKAVEEIVRCLSVTPESDIHSRLCTPNDISFFEQHGISRKSIADAFIENIFSLVCEELIETFATISQFCYEMEHTRPPFDQLLEYYDVFEDCEAEEDKQEMLKFLHEAEPNMIDFDKINFKIELDKKIKHHIYDCADYFKFSLSEYISFVCQGIDTFDYEGLLEQYKFEANFTHDRFNFTKEGKTENGKHNPSEE